MKMKQNTRVFSFDKDSYLISPEIEELYELKLNIAPNDDVKQQIQRAMMYDPRRDDIYFGSEAAAQKGKIVADKLSAMSEDKFLKSDYSYLWLNELTGESIFKVIDSSVLTSARSI